MCLPVSAGCSQVASKGDGPRMGMTLGFHVEAPGCPSPVPHGGKIVASAPSSRPLRLTSSKRDTCAPKGKGWVDHPCGCPAIKGIMTGKILRVRTILRKHLAVGMWEDICQVRERTAQGIGAGNAIGCTAQESSPTSDEGPPSATQRPGARGLAGA